MAGFKIFSIDMTVLKFSVFGCGQNQIGKYKKGNRRDQNQ
jgi:hypothetical protein